MIRKPQAKERKKISNRWVVVLSISFEEELRHQLKIVSFSIKHMVVIFKKDLYQVLYKLILGLLFVAFMK